MFSLVGSFFIGMLVVYVFFLECVVRRRVSKEVAEAIGAETKWQTIGNPSDWTRVGRKEFLELLFVTIKYIRHSLYFTSSEIFKERTS